MSICIVYIINHILFYFIHYFPSKLHFLEYSNDRNTFGTLMFNVLELVDDEGNPAKTAMRQDNCAQHAKRAWFHIYFRIDGIFAEGT